MNAFINALIKMNMRGIIIILVVLFVRFLLKKLRISHKYIIGLWTMVFLFFIIPWKLSLPVGFWNNASLPEEVRVITENTLRVNEGQENNDTANMMSPSVMDNHISAGMPVAPLDGNVETITTGPVEPAGQNAVGLNEVKEGDPKKPEIENVLGLLWAIGLSFLFGHMLYTYFVLKRKLRFSVLYQDNIRLAEDIDMPMVFGFIYPRIYLPISMETGNYSYVIAHEKMHIKRKDGLFKMLAYVVCLIHWFNPFIWMAYILFGNDMEKACDEEVIRSMGKETRKEYAYALLHMAAENGRKKKKIFVAPICFDEGNVKSRIRNIMKYKYTLPGIGTAVVIVILALSAMFLTEAKDARQNDSEEDTVKAEGAGEDTTGENNEDNTGADIGAGEITEALPGVYVPDLDALKIEDNFLLKNYYITGRYTASNYYYIDEDGVLWGTGSNEFGQLGTGTYGTEEYHEEPVKIAEQVLSVDASCNDYFCIFLTEDGELYGMGLNYSGLLLGKGSESQVYSQYDFQKVTEPVLLMTDVAYARAGMECIVALKTDQTAYWWGQYAPTTNTHVDAGWGNYWKVEEDASNSVKMLAVEPVKIMEHCRYITTGSYTGAAISEAGELYTWGSNIFGQCGTSVTKDDFVRTPVKVMDDVKMVWPDRIYFSEPLSSSSEFVRWETDYKYVTFVMTADHTLMAAGLDLGDNEKVTEVNGDLVETQTHRYSDSFVPVRAVEYSVENILKILSELKFGMSIEEVEEILDSAGLRTFRVVGESVYSEGYDTCLSALYNQYHCYFDSQNQLAMIAIQEGGSRDGRFTLGMSLSDLKKTVEEAGSSLTKDESDPSRDIWFYQDQTQQIQYEFFMYGGNVSTVHETTVLTYGMEGKQEDAPEFICCFQQEDVAVVPEVQEYSYEDAVQIGEVLKIDGMLPGLSMGTWYIVDIDGVEYFYGKYNFDESLSANPDYGKYILFGWAIVDNSYELANGIKVGMNESEILEQFPNMAVMDFENDYIYNKVTGHQGWNGIAYPHSYAGMDSNWDYEGKDYYEWTDQFDYIMIADIDLNNVDTLPIYVGLLIKDQVVAAITFYYPTAG